MAIEPGPVSRKLKTGRSASRAVAACASLAIASAFLMAGASAVAAPGDEHLAGLNYVALGDSYAAGYGLTPTTGLPVAGCDQSTSNYPHQVATELGLVLTDVTCSGAETTNITTTAQVTYSGTAPIQDTALSASTDIVTLTIGGNDLGFVDILTACAALTSSGPVVGDPASPFSASDCKSLFAPDPLTDLLAAKIAGVVAPALDAVLADVAAKAPNAKIFVVGYPALTSSTMPTGPDGCFTSALGSGTPPFPVNSYPYTTTDVPYLHSIEALFNQAITDAATASGATMISLFEASDTHSPCADPAEAYLNGITIDSLTLSPLDIELAPGVMHPNAAGAAFQATQVEAAIRAAFPPPEPTDGGGGLAATGTDGALWIGAGGLLLLLSGGGLLALRRRFAS